MPNGISDQGIVGCIECGAVHGPASALLTELQEDVGNLERELRVKRSQIKSLKHEQDQSLKQSPYYPAAMRVLNNWASLCAPNTRELTGGGRLEKCIARLKGGFTEQDLDLAVLGYSRFPYVGKNGRIHLGTKKQWFADAELIFRTPQNVKRGMDMASDDAPEIPYEMLERTHWRRVQQANRKLITNYLTNRMGGPLESNDFLMWTCPVCDNHPSMTLRVAPVGYSFLATCSGCGLTDERLLRMISGTEIHQQVRAVTPVHQLGLV